MNWTIADTGHSIPERFELEARLRPATQAIAGTEWEPSFAEVDAAANRLADEVLARRPGGAGRVALLLPHDSPLFAAALGVLKAGKTVVVLNPSDPPARLEQIAADVEPELVLTDVRHRDLALRAGGPATDLVTVPERPDGSPHGAPTGAVPPDAAAFLIYTSGSTGRPKWVIQTHRNILHNALRLTNGVGLRADDRIALLASLSSGQGVATTWSTMLNGATLCPFPLMERGVTGLAAWLAEQRITVFTAAPSVFRTFVRTLDGRRVHGVRLVRLGAEQVFRSDFEAFRRHFETTSRFAITLSASETGNIAQYLLTADADPREERLPVGRPADGVELLLLDDHGAEVGPGETGEIVVRSSYLSPGYWRDEARTAERFVLDEAAGATGLFRTGDLGRLSSDGLLTVTGRTDSRVKVHGHRVELSEVERALAARPEVAAAAVCASSTPRGDVKLTGYVAVRPGRHLTSGSLRDELRATLPDHAVPTALVFLDALPLTPHGKVDRSELARIEPPSQPSEPMQEAMSETEELLASIWSDALGLERVGRDADFLDLGGDSLTAAIVGAQVHAAFGVEIHLRAFAESPTVTAMARLVERLRADAGGEAGPPLTRASRAEPLPMSFSQERVWRSSHTPAGHLGHTMAIPIRIRGPLDTDALRRSIDHIVRRHEVLRTTFAERDGRPVQIVHAPTPLELPLVDLRTAPEAEARARELVSREAHTPFDLEQGPLLRLRLVRLRDDEHWLVRVNHHIISDGWSWRVFFEELAVLYEDCLRGGPLSLPAELAYQYGDFAAWQRRSVHPAEPRYQEELAWWRDVFRDEHVPLTPPFARTAPPVAPVEPGVAWWGLQPEVSRELDLLGRSGGATYFMVRLATFAGHLALETGREDVVLGIYVTNRRRTELQAMFGDFTNLATLRVRFTADATFRQWLARVRAAVIETSEHIEIPYLQVCQELGRDGVAPPEIRAVFGLTHGLPPLRFGGLEVETLPTNLQLTPTGFTFLMDRWHEADRCQVYFDFGSYDPSGVRAFVTRFQHLARAVCAQPDRGLGDLLGDG